MITFENLINNAAEIEHKIGHVFKDRTHLALAFVHRSFVNENREITQHNERLEFLGDSILGMIIADYLYRYLPATPEGELSYLRSRLVEASSCVEFVQKLDVEKYLLLGRGERLNNGRGRDSILADLFEAIIGAIYIDSGLESAQKFIFKNFSRDIEAILKLPIQNWKAELQDYCQKNYQETPVYTVLSETGPDHSKSFTISVLIRGEEMGSGVGSSKKEAQQEAARIALMKVKPCQ